MAFIKLKDGSKIRSDTITAVMLGDGRAADQHCREFKPRVIVYFGTGDHNNCVVLDCETVEERNALSDSIMAEIEAANANVTGLAHGKDK